MQFITCRLPGNAQSAIKDYNSENFFHVYMQDAVEDLYNFKEFSQPPKCSHELKLTQKK